MELDILQSFRDIEAPVLGDINGVHMVTLKDDLLREAAKLNVDLLNVCRLGNIDPNEPNLVKLLHFATLSQRGERDVGTKRKAPENEASGSKKAKSICFIKACCYKKKMTDEFQIINKMDADPEWSDEEFYATPLPGTDVLLPSTHKCTEPERQSEKLAELEPNEKPTEPERPPNSPTLPERPPYRPAQPERPNEKPAQSKSESSDDDIPLCQIQKRLQKKRKRQAKQVSTESSELDDSDHDKTYLPSNESLSCEDSDTTPLIKRKSKWIRKRIRPLKREEGRRLAQTRDNRNKNSKKINRQNIHSKEKQREASDLKKPRDVRQQGEFKVLQKDALVATVWKDKRLVYHLSTLSQPADIRDARRRVLGNHLELQQPHTVYAYNKFMGGVDLHDQFRAKYNIGCCEI
ncbi:hypothetical protein MAR_012517 [Mya arenaria]|uniref:PiggyBac transposable element-derived protein domain-containing protein n=1 Tax=Mya arenaria TaxID=6604 RepID=A0ABY7G106_MYAAR|nr:hypothetical protein MAR_012517 [Mya arenaria]